MLVPPFHNGSVSAIACSNPDTSKVHDARMSFPSGHSSCSMAIGSFAALYTLWCVYRRGPAALSNPAGDHAAQQQQGRPRGCGRAALARLGAEAASLALLAVVLFDLAWPWGVAASRFIDNRHNVSDVVGGLLLGLCIAPVFVLRLAGRSAGGSAVAPVVAPPAAALDEGGAGAVLPVAAV